MTDFTFYAVSEVFLDGCLEGLTTRHLVSTPAYLGASRYEVGEIVGKLEGGQTRVTSIEVLETVPDEEYLSALYRLRRALRS